MCTVLALGAGTGCHSRQPSASATRPASAPQLASLPAASSLAWVRPSVLIADASSDDDASATLGAVRQMRLDVETVLKGERWRVLDSDTAQFVATIALARRTTFQQEQRTEAGASTPGRTCDATTGACRASTSRPTQIRTVSVPVTTERVVFVIVRRRDGARHVYASGFLNAASSGGLFAKQVIELLRAR
jgi:hypothetical protein